MLLVTSLPPKNPRTDYCVYTWQQLGYEILAVQDVYRPEYPVRQVLGQRSSLWPDRPTISSIINTGLQHNKQVCLINSDIELVDTLPEKDGVGIRWNYFDTHEVKFREQWGIDCVITSVPIPEVPLAIGKPWWDYWILEHLQPTHWIVDPILMHKEHTIVWDESDWLIGMEWFNQTIGTNYTSRFDAARHRIKFPYHYQYVDDDSCKNHINFQCQVVNNLADDNYYPPQEVCRTCKLCLNPKTINPITMAHADRLLTQKNQPTLNYDPGPGTRLAQIISWFVTERPGCNCKERAAYMDAWGNERCWANKSTILAWMEEAALDYGFIYSKWWMEKLLYLVTHQHKV